MCHTRHDRVTDTDTDTDTDMGGVMVADTYTNAGTNVVITEPIVQTVIDNYNLCDQDMILLQNLSKNPIFTRLKHSRLVGVASHSRDSHSHSFQLDFQTTDSISSSTSQHNIALIDSTSVAPAPEPAPAPAPAATCIDIQSETKSKNCDSVSDCRSESDHFGVPLFDLLGYACVPHCGVYGEDYQPWTPLLMLRVPSSNAVLNSISTKAASHLHTDATNALSTDAYIMVHPCPIRRPCQRLLCTSKDEMNVMLHCWAFPSVKFNMDLDVSVDVDVGVFDTIGVKEVHQDMTDIRARGCPFERLETRAVTMHSMRFSPCNNHIGLEHCSMHAFVVVAKKKLSADSKQQHSTEQVISLHVLAGNVQVEQALRTITSSANSLGELVHDLVTKAPKELTCLPWLAMKLYHILVSIG
jgi:hypothetical protein